ncbi:LysR family transcriptional regulator [Salinicola halimionae]|uniref:LysR family transcriptional regulator n=1 Tax=Salinicola halimionae TaxID=1949081 RepID=UPI000DA20EA2|nr:LysR family transcriptional regulator [Salinicola halimionae]
MVNWTDLQFFSALARTGSLSAAARELKVDHVTVGRRISSLEKSLDTRLVDKLPRSRPLTERGEAIAVLVREVERMVNSLPLYSDVVNESLDATVRLSAPPGLAVHWITPLLPVLKKHYPKLKVALHYSTTFAALDKGECDLALRMTRPEDKDLVVRKIGNLTYDLYASLEYVKTPSDSYEFIVYPQALEHLPQQVWLHRYRGGRGIALESSDVLAHYMAVKSGLGIAALPTFIGDSDSGLVRLEAMLSRPDRPVWLTMYPDLRNSASVRVLVDFIADNARTILI